MNGVIDAFVSTKADDITIRENRNVARKTDLISTPLIRNAFLKFIYSATLFGMERGRFFEFWRAHPLILNGKLFTLQVMFTHFWNSRSKTTVGYCCEVLRDLDYFCIEKGIDCQALLQNALRQRLFLEPELWLQLAGAMNEVDLGDADMSSMLLGKLDRGFRLMCPEMRLEKVDCRRTASVMSASFVLDLGDPGILPFDFEATLGIILKHLPVRFKYPSYEAVVCSSEMQQISDMIGNGAESKEQKVHALIEQGFGHWERFSDFAQRNGFGNDLKMYGEQMVFVADREFVCPVRKKKIRKNTAYGAPAFLFTIVHQKADAKDGAFLRCIAREINYPNRTAFHCIEKYHIDLLNDCEVRNKFRYFRETESIYLDKTFITSGAQARLLKEILEKYLEKGKAEFERKQFIGKDDLICSPQNTGFAVRLARIQALLKKHKSSVSIIKEGRGRFRIEAAEPFDLNYE